MSALELPVLAAQLGRPLCAEIDTEIFFPDKGGSLRPAKAVCELCEMREDCLRGALDRGEQHGVFGGLSAHERRDLSRSEVSASLPSTAGRIKATPEKAATSLQGLTKTTPESAKTQGVRMAETQDRRVPWRGVA